MDVSLCVGCYRESRFLPFRTSSNSLKNDTEYTVSKIIKILKENNFHIHANATPHEVHEIYTYSLTPTQEQSLVSRI